MPRLLSLAPCLALLALACTGDKDSAADTGPQPAVTFLDPLDGGTVTAGDVQLSLIVENFTLTDPAKHNEGTPEGYLSITVDGGEVVQTASTQITITLAAGAHTVGAGLFYADGDATGAEAEIGVTAE